MCCNLALSHPAVGHTICCHRQALPRGVSAEGGWQSTLLAVRLSSKVMVSLGLAEHCVGPRTSKEAEVRESL